MNKNIPKNSIKILRIIARLNIGGPAIHTILLTKGLNSRLFKSYLVTGKPDSSEGNMDYFAREKEVDTEYIPELQREIGFFDIIAFFKLLKYMKRIKPDIVHTHTAKAGALGRLAAFIAAVPIRIHTFHGHVFDGYFNPFKAKLFMIIERMLSRFTTKTIVVSEKVRDEIVNELKIVPQNKCVIVKLGLELDKFLNNTTAEHTFRTKRGIEKDAITIGIVGRLVPIKNHIMFLKAAKEIKSRNPEKKIKFVVVGDGEMRDYLEKYAEDIGLRDSVIFTSWVKDLKEVYADIDIVTLTSLNEGTPVSLIEAMASAKPVVATNVGGVKDLVVDNENGLLVNNNDVKEFSEKVLYLINDEKKRVEMGKKGREFVKARHSKERLIADIEALYKECLKEKYHTVNLGEA